MVAASILIASLVVVGYTYVGYPVVCLVRARLWPKAIRRRAIRPRVTVVIAAYREAATIDAKLASVAAQSYPAELTEVIVACDGSDDGTPERARAAMAQVLGGRGRVLELPQRRGKPAALNAAVAAADGEVLVFTDARQRLSGTAVERLVEDLGDPELGAVGGELMLEGDAPVGAYWKYEKLLRKLEGRAGSTVGVSGALYALRRELWAPLPEETILDDVLVPMRVRLAGRRVGFQSEAQAFDRAVDSGREFRRKVRTLSGNFQLLALLPQLLLPWRNPSWGDFVSHKLLRLLVPYGLVSALLASACLPWRGWALLLTSGQLFGYALAGLRGVGLLTRSRLAGLCETFVVLNAAAVAGLLRFLRYRRHLPW